MRRSPRTNRCKLRKSLRLEVLEQRQLLAGDVLSIDHNYWNPYDVNDDGQISALDALGIINRISLSGEAERALGAAPMFYDVNADHDVTASDALGVINAIRRGEEVGELVELLLTARDLSNEPLPVDGNGEINLEVGQIFELEVSYDDLRLFNDRLGAFQLFTDISVSQGGVLSPVLNETQRVIIDKSVLSVPATSLTFSIEGSSTTYESSINDFRNAPVNEMASALTAFGYSADQYDLIKPEFSDGAIGFQIHFVGDEFGNRNLPNIMVDVNESDPNSFVRAETVEFAPFLADGVTPNSDAVQFNIVTYSRTFNDNEEFFANYNRGAFDPDAGFIGIGGLGLVPISGGGVPHLTDDGNFIEPFDAFSLRVFVNRPVSGLVVGVNPGEDREATLLYGRDEPVPQDMVLINPENTLLTLNATSGTQPGTLSIATGSLSVDENAGTASVTVARRGGSGGQVSVDYSTADATATGGSDYITTSGVLEFADGEVQQVITVPIIDDSDVESSESFTLALSNVAGGASLGTVESTITIVGNDGIVVPIVTGPVTALLTEDDSIRGVSLLSGAFDPSGGLLDVESVSIIEGDSNGIQVRGHIVAVDPSAYGALVDGQSETIVLNYTVVSGSGGSVPQAATITITGVNDAPSAQDDGDIRVVSGTTITIPVLLNDNPGAGESQRFSIIGVQYDDSLGTVIRNLDGTLSFTSADRFSGIVPLTYTIQDSDGGIDTASLRVFVEPAASLEGHAYCDANGDGIENPGEASAGATVFMDLNGDRVHNASEPTTMTDSDGDFVFGAVDAGQATVAWIVPGGCGGVPEQFAAVRSDIAVGLLAREIESVDFDGDGDDDLLIASDLSNDLKILRNDGGTFGDGGTIQLSDRPQAIAVWQPAVGSAVVAVAAVGASQTLEQVNAARPGFGAVFVVNDGQTQRLEMGDGPIDVAIDDFNEDGLPDFVSAAFRSSDFHLRLSGTDQVVRLSDASLAISVTTGDFDRDGNRDIALAGHGDTDDGLQILFGDGHGNFPRSLIQRSFSRLVSVGAANLDGDFGDELIALGHDGDLGIFTMDPSGFRQTGRALLESGTTKFEVGDLNRDGLLDLAVIRAGSAKMDLLVGDGQGGIFHVRGSNEAVMPFDAAFGDFDGDHMDDLAVLDVVQTTSAGGFSFPSAITMLKLNVSVQHVDVSAGAGQQVNFATSLGALAGDPDSDRDNDDESMIAAIDLLHARRLI